MAAEELTRARLPLRRSRRGARPYFTSLNGHKPAQLYDLVLREVEEPLFRAVLEYAGQSVPRRRILGINRGTLRKKLRQFGLPAQIDRCSSRSAAPCCRFPTKTGLVDFAARCSSATSSCCPPAAPPRLLRDAGIAGTEVSGYTGFPEIMDGRVKTLHPKVHGGLLAGAASTMRSWRSTTSRPSTCWS